MTLLSIEVLFFIINISIQSLLLFPPIIEEIVKCWLNYLVYIIYVYSATYVLIIPFYEFLIFPFLTESNPLCHLGSFTYINESDIGKKNNDIIINIILSIIWILFLILYKSSYNSVWFEFYKDILESIILIFLLIYYTSIILSNFLLFIIHLIQLLIKTNLYYKNIKYISKDGISPLPDINLINQYLIII